MGDYLVMLSFIKRYLRKYNIPVVETLHIGTKTVSLLIALLASHARYCTVQYGRWEADNATNELLYKCSLEGAAKAALWTMDHCEKEPSL